MKRFVPVVLGIALCSCELWVINAGVDFLTRAETPKASCIVEQVSPCAAKIHLGWFTRPFQHPNVMQAKPAVFREKRWHFVSLAGERFLMGMAVVNVGYMANSFLYVYDIQQDEFIDFTHSGLACLGHVTENSLSGSSFYTHAGYTLRIKNVGGRHTAEFDCLDGQGNHVFGSFTVREDGEPLVNSREVLPKQVVYTHQNSQCSASGQVSVNGVVETFDWPDATATMDFTVGHHDYETRWNWASAGGTSTVGARLGVNFAANFEGGEAVVVYWVDGAIHRIPAIDFQYADVMQPWRITSPDGGVDLTFTPWGCAEQDISVGDVLQAAFQQPFGRFTGTITDAQGTVHTIDDMVGVTERHLAKW